ncbi:hypothetical protein [Xanthomonas graminis]|uniref:hypothetical protein n=2 Tax=Xanthomonas graminis TaxID=3390026 RepID=UPI0012DAEE5F|nr:hypothetical protein [Xanthomonas translucens]
MKAKYALLMDPQSRFNVCLDIKASVHGLVTVQNKGACVRAFILGGICGWAFFAPSLFVSVDAFAESASVADTISEVLQSSSKFDAAPQARFKYISARYRELIGPELKSVDSLSVKDVRALFDASAELAFYANLSEGLHGVRYVRDMKVSYAVLKKRHQLEEGDIDTMRATFESYREFYNAEELTPGITNSVLDKLNESSVIRQQGLNGRDFRKVIAFDENIKKFIYESQPIEHGLQIVVVAGCHFASDAAFSIDADDEIRSAFKKANAIWLASGDTPLKSNDFLKWKEDHPRQSLKVAFDNSEWPEINFYAIPRFYFFRKNALFAVLTGWRSSEEGLNDIRNVIRSQKFSEED